MAWPIFRGLFDDASMFPPASLPMADAVAGHLRHQTAWYREMSGPFVCASTNITELSAALTAADVAELDLALVLRGNGPASGAWQQARPRFPIPRREALTIGARSAAGAIRGERVWRDGVPAGSAAAGTGLLRCERGDPHVLVHRH
jgi:hypothetical protein